MSPKSCHHSPKWPSQKFPQRIDIKERCSPETKKNSINQLLSELFIRCHVTPNTVRTKQTARRQIDVTSSHSIQTRPTTSQRTKGGGENVWKRVRTSWPKRDGHGVLLEVTGRRLQVFRNTNWTGASRCVPLSSYVVLHTGHVWNRKVLQRGKTRPATFSSGNFP